MFKSRFVTLGILLVFAPLYAQIPVLSDIEFLNMVQKAGVDFFWREANASNGLIRDRNTQYAPCSIASVGFGLSAICIGIEQGWIPREAGRERILKTLKTFWQKPQGRAATGFIGYKGFFYHFLDMNNASRAWNSELSSIDTALLLAGMLDAKQFFFNNEPEEQEIRALADSIYNRVDWEWMRNYQSGLLMEWTPERGFGSNWWRGYNEAMIMYILGLGSPTHPIPKSTWSAWTSGYEWKNQYGHDYVIFPPLFGHHYSHCWIDFRNIQDDYMRSKQITYFENSRRATYAQRAYCIANPGKFKGYGEMVWGITACDGPNGYKARGAPPPQNDDGTIAPTAAGGSIPFAPEICIPALRHFYDNYKLQIWTSYGFRDAFNLTQNWWGPDVIGIDQGTIVIAIENHLRGSVWRRFMQNPVILKGLERAGFTQINRVLEPQPAIPVDFVLQQNFPNPFNHTTLIEFNLPRASHVALEIFDLKGRKMATLLDQFREAGSHSIRFNSNNLPSGAYLYQLTTEQITVIKKMLLLK